MAAQLLKIHTPRIDPARPWDNDDFGRRENGERLARLVRNAPGPFVLALKAPWGAGKTVFLERWAHHLENDIKRPVPVVRLDLWEHDFMDDPLDAFIIALNDRLLRDSRKTTGKLSKTASAVTAAGAQLMPLATRIVRALATAGVSEGATLAAETVKAIGNQLIATSKAHKISVNEFRRKLSEARQVLTKTPTDITVQRSPLVFVIDELDRCRPDFSVRALERIKHFFSVEGIVFVIATDGDNLPSAVQALYGPSVQGERYLRKFFDFEFRLPDPTPEQVTLSFFGSAGILDQFGTANASESINDERKRWKENNKLKSQSLEGRAIIEMIEAFIAFSTCMSLSLRDQVQALTMLVAVIRSTDRDHPTLPAVLVFVVCLRFSAPKEYELIASGYGSLSNFLQRNTPAVFTIPGVIEKVGADQLKGHFGTVGDHLELYKTFGGMSLSQRQDWQRKVSNATTVVPHDRIQQGQLNRWCHEQIDASFDCHVQKLMNVAGAFVPS